MWVIKWQNRRSGTVSLIAIWKAPIEVPIIAVYKEMDNVAHGFVVLGLDNQDTL